MRVFLPFLLMPMLASAVEFQPLAAQARRVGEALQALGEPLPAPVRAALDSALASGDVAKVEAALEPQVLFIVSINPEMRVKVAPGPAKPELFEAGWRQFLVKVINEAGSTAPLIAQSPHAQKVYSAPERRRNQPANPVPAAERWLDLAMADARPMTPNLSGLALDYRIIQLYSRDAGKREARIVFDIGQGTQDLGFRAEADVLFDIAPAREITLRVKDENGAPTTAAFLIRDTAGRVHPSQAKRVAPDFFFHPQIYRNDGEKIRLPDGEYTIDLSRGPESVPEIRSVKIGATTTELAFATKRWIDPSLTGWWSGDHHIHAAGCAHYTSPSEGVHAPDMARHCRGEDLKIGANLTWGPCFDYQKQFFTGKEDATSQWPYLLRYDVEVSGFGSHQSGHLCLLRLTDQMYPGGNSSAHWPTLGLNTLRWAKKQGAVCGPAHTGWGLKLPDNSLPNYAVPPFDGIGACEYIVDVTHEVPGPDGKLVPAVDFLSTVDTPATWELNIWYHTLNAGFRTRISGETDFPCIYGERVGLGRSYVKVDGRLNYDAWCEGVRAGRCYVSDGYSHLMDFKAAGIPVGEKGSEAKLAASGEIDLTARVAALLARTPDTRLRGLGFFVPPFGRGEDKPYWHIERARVGDSREVQVEALVNGESVARQRFVADGTERDVKFRVAIKRSSWVALRILPSSHTNPVFVIVGDKPIRADKRSIEWCLAGVDACWAQKERTYAAAERDDALAAYDHARKTYRTRLAEAE
jgi:hypothetical protein